MSYFLEVDEKEEDLIYYDLDLLDWLLQGLAALASIAAVHNISSTLEGLLGPKYLTWIIKNIKDLEENGHPDWHTKAELIDRFVMINDFYTFLENNCHRYSKTTYNYLKDVFQKFKSSYVLWDNND